MLDDEIQIFEDETYLPNINYVFLGRNQNRDFVFVEMLDSGRISSRNAYTVITLQKGTFVSDGKDIVSLYDKSSARRVSRYLTKQESEACNRAKLAYVLKSSMKKSPRKN